MVETGPVRLLRYPDGSTRVGHLCDRKAREAGVIRCAPLLAEGHTVIWSEMPTVTPSILCSDCGLHGFVTTGRWTAA
jgi:hypothetical protein